MEVKEIYCVSVITQICGENGVLTENHFFQNKDKAIDYYHKRVAHELEEYPMERSYPISHDYPMEFSYKDVDDVNHMITLDDGVFADELNPLFVEKKYYDEEKRLQS